LPSTDADNCRNNVEFASRLFAEHGSFIRATILSKIEDEVQADDIFQDFFLDLVRKPVPKHIKNITSYLYKAITNDIVDHIRRRQRYELRIGRYSKNHNYSINTVGVEDALIIEEEISNVLRILGRQLKIWEYRAVTLRYGKDMSLKEVADIMHIKRRSVSRYVSVGIKKIHQFLAVERGPK